MSEHAAGATPGSGASPDHAYSFGPSWATYHLPFVGARLTLAARDAGVWFKGEPPAGGDGDGDKGGNADPPKPPDPPTPATGDGDKDPEGLGEAGKEAIRREREAAKAARDEAAAVRKELDELKAATQSDQEKATAEAVKTAKAEVRTEFESKIRKAEARSALRAAGMTNEKALDLYANAPEFAALKVTDDGSVEGLTEVIDGLRKAVPESFATEKPKPAPAGGPSRGPQGGDKGDRPNTLGEAIAAKYGAPQGG